MNIIYKIAEKIEDLEDELDKLTNLPQSDENNNRIKEIKDRLYFFKWGEEPLATAN